MLKIIHRLLVPNASAVVNLISEEAFKNMKDDPEYREKILSALKRDLTSSFEMCIRDRSDYGEKKSYEFAITEYDSGEQLCEEQSALEACQLLFLDINMPVSYTHL